MYIKKTTVFVFKERICFSDNVWTETRNGPPVATDFLPVQTPVLIQHTHTVYVCGNISEAIPHKYTQ